MDICLLASCCATRSFGRVLKQAQVYAGEVWILDYKRNLLASEQIAYQQQMAQYRQAVAAVLSHQHIRAALILVDGRLHEFGGPLNQNTTVCARA